MEIIKVTDRAIEQFKKAIEAEGISTVRVGVLGGGCSGFSFNLELKDGISENDWVQNIGGLTFVVDEISATYLMDTTIDYEDSLVGGFKFVSGGDSPIARQCGCGKSFGV